jgi:nucleotide-binding universal stress UspA family protein
MTAPTDPRGAVLVGVDGSADSLQAVTWAAHEAVRSGVPLRILHASPWSMLAEKPGRSDRAWDENSLGRRARRILESATKHARDVEPGIQLDAELVCGDGPAVMATACAGAATVVVGRRGLGTEGTRLVGSAAAILAEQVRAAVVVCGYDARHSQLGGQEGPVVVGVDNTARSDCSADQRNVLDTAFALAEKLGVRLTVLHAWRDVDWGPADTLAGYLTDWPTAAKDAQVALIDLLGDWYERFPGVATTLDIVDSRPAYTLIEASAGASVVVLGGCGRASLRGSRFGPVARRVTAGAGCPVLVVPATTSEV